MREVPHLRVMPEVRALHAQERAEHRPVRRVQRRERREAVPARRPLAHRRTDEHAQPLLVRARNRARVRAVRAQRLCGVAPARGAPVRSRDKDEPVRVRAHGVDGGGERAPGAAERVHVHQIVKLAVEPQPAQETLHLVDRHPPRPARPSRLHAPQIVPNNPLQILVRLVAEHSVCAGGEVSAGPEPTPPEPVKDRAPPVLAHV
mmetsp:Transcript_5109/g.17773  ORF Transcript_5109/g.17773 Transcript_5109/m.17773 type:complete len:204 (+) Transcript_5109:508-1119(+)